MVSRSAKPGYPVPFPPFTPPESDRPPSGLLERRLNSDLCGLRFNDVTHAWGFAIYLASSNKYEDNILPSGHRSAAPSVRRHDG